MMDGTLDCSNGWLMITSGVLIFSVLALGGAALVKYLFFADRRAIAG